MKQRLEEAGEAYILVDLGDHMDRANLITEGSMGKANIELMNEVGYDYATIGNNEGITFSKAELDVLYRHANFQILLNNLYEPNGQRPSWLTPYTIHQFGELKVGLIGTTIDFIPFYQILGWEMEKAFESIKRDVSVLREKVDFLVLLSHLGLPQDEQLVKEIEGIDLIIGAHTHHLLRKGLKIGKTVITQAGKFGEFVGHVTVEWDLGRASIKTTCLSVDQEVADPKTVQLLQKWQGKAEQELAQPIAFIQEEIPEKWFEESVISNLLAEGLREWCNSTIALVNSGVILDRLAEGMVTRKDIHRICPHPINPCLVNMKGYELWSLLERSLAEEIQHKELKGFGFRGKVLGMLAVDGLELRVEYQRNRKKQIKSIVVNGSPLEANQEYAVATLDMFTFQGLFPELYQPAKVKFFLPEFIRDVLQFRLAQGNIEQAKAKRWRYLV